MPKTQKSSNPPGRPAVGKTLNPQTVAEAALRLIETECLDKFSMRRLGQILGVEAMALYNHFQDKDDMLDAVASLALMRIELPPPRGPWRARVKQVSLSVRRLALEHPNLFRLAMSRPTPPSAAFPLLEGALTAYADAGLSPAAQVSAYHTIFLYIRGFCLWEIDEVGRSRHLEAAANPGVALEYPRVAAALPRIFAPDLDRQFEEGLDIILRGLCAA